MSSRQEWMSIRSFEVILTRFVRKDDIKIIERYNPRLQHVAHERSHQTGRIEHGVVKTQPTLEAGCDYWPCCSFVVRLRTSWHVCLSIRAKDSRMEM